MTQAVAEVFPCWWRRLAAFALGFIVLHVLVLPIPLESGVGLLLEKRWMAPPGEVVEYLAALDDGGRGLYAAFQIIDLLFIATYGSVLASGLALAGSRVAPKAMPWLIGLVAVVVVADVVEDALLLALISGGREPWVGLPATLGYVTSAKLVTAGAAIVSLAIVAFQALRASDRRPSPGFGALAGDTSKRDPKRRMPRSSVVIEPAEASKLLPWERASGEPAGVGISLSGGGLRAASFSLGVLQILQDRAALLFGEKAADLLSAVSGGSYIAATYALGGHERNRSPERFASQDPVAPGSPEEHHVLANGYFLCSGLYRMGAFAFLNVLALAALFVWLGALTGGIAHLSALGEANVFAVLTAHGHRLLGALPGGVEAVGYLVIGTVAAASLWWTIRLAYAERGALTRIAAVIPFAVYGLLGAFTAQAASRLGTGWLIGVPGILAVGTLVAGGLAFIGSRGEGQQQETGAFPVLLNAAALLAPRLFGLSLVFSSSAFWYAFFAREQDVVLLVAYFVSLLAPTVMAWILGHASMHRVYRDLLAGCFAVVRDGENVRAVPGLPMSQLEPPASGAGRYPRLLISATANVRAPHQRNRFVNFVPFVFSHDVCGVPAHPEASFPTAKLELLREPGRFGGGLEPLVSVLTAVAATGAAVSPSMGRFTTPSIRFLAASLNARLGRWIPNAFRHDVQKKVAEVSAPTRLKVGRFLGGGYDDLLPELTGVAGSRMYVSDGGHYDNLGLLVMLRAKPKVIWCVDASDDRHGLADEFRRVQDLAWSDMRIAITNDASVFQTTDGLYRTTHSVGAIRYTDGTEGKLILLKLGLTAESDPDLIARRSVDRGFPHHPTMPQQFYSQGRMDAYRRVGSEVASRALDTPNL